MSQAACDDDGPPDRVGDRYTELEPGDGELVIYDAEDPTAWIQSDAFTSRDDAL